MKISESTPASFLDPLAGHRKRTAESREDTPADFQSLSLPSILTLTEASHPARETFLSALSQSLREGLYQCETEQVAETILTRGLQAPTNGEE